MTLRAEVAEDKAAEDEDDDDDDDDEDEEAGRFRWFRIEVSLPPASPPRGWLPTSRAPVTLTGECSGVQAQKKAQAAAAWRQRAK